MAELTGAGSVLQSPVWVDVWVDLTEVLVLAPESATSLPPLAAVQTRHWMDIHSMPWLSDSRTTAKRAVVRLQPTERRRDEKVKGMSNISLTGTLWSGTSTILEIVGLLDF